MGASEETIALLTRIATAVERSAAVLERMEKRSAARSPKEVADDQDLDSKYGDPEIKLRTIPREWEGQLITGCRMSECPPDYLDCLANLYDWQAQKADEGNQTTDSGKPIALYRRRDAARARGWAKRLRAGWKPTHRESDSIASQIVENIENGRPEDEGIGDGGGW